MSSFAVYKDKYKQIDDFLVISKELSINNVDEMKNQEGN